MPEKCFPFPGIDVHDLSGFRQFPEGILILFSSHKRSIPKIRKVHETALLAGSGVFKCYRCEKQGQYLETLAAAGCVFYKKVTAYRAAAESSEPAQPALAGRRRAVLTRRWRKYSFFM